MTTSSNGVLAEGFAVCGKWNRRSYRIVKLLGEGANGKVYLVHSGKNAFALKFGFDTVDLQMEINVLRELDKQSAHAYMYDADDAELDGSIHPFYVMRYIRGEPPLSYIRRNGFDWFYMIGFNLLRKLEGLHRQGYIFGDLKANNMLVTAFGEVELVDYGGVTEEGRSVKQFTEIYDCGFWNAGERVASVSYDLFSFAIVCLHMNGMDRQLKTLADSTLPLNRSVDDLLALVDRCPPCAPVAAVLKQALTGKLDSCAKAASLWRDGMHSVGVSGAGRGQKQSQWIGTAFLASLGLLVSLLCVFWLSN